MSYHRPPIFRMEHGRMLAARPVAAKLAERHPDMVRRHCMVIACDVTSRQPLYDAEECAEILARRRRVACVSIPHTRSWA